MDQTLNIILEIFYSQLGRKMYLLEFLISCLTFAGKENVFKIWWSYHLIFYVANFVIGND